MNWILEKKKWFLLYYRTITWVMELLWQMLCFVFFWPKSLFALVSLLVMAHTGNWLFSSQRQWQSICLMTLNALFTFLYHLFIFFTLFYLYFYCTYFMFLLLNLNLFCFCRCCYYCLYLIQIDQCKLYTKTNNTLI